MLGVLNGWVGERIVVVVSRYGIPGVNFNGERIYGLHILAGICVKNTYFKVVDEYTRNRHKQDRIDKNMTDIFLVRRNMIISVLNAWSERGLLDHIVICWLAFYCRWYRNRNVIVKIRGMKIES